MKRTVLMSALAFLCGSMWAAKAYNLPVTVKQTDGTRLTIVGCGDEHFNYLVTTDGVVVCQKGDGYYVATIDEGGNISASGVLAHQPGQRSAAEMQVIGQQNKAAMIKAGGNARRVAREMDNLTDATLLPHKGSPKVLVILAEFSDVKFTVSNVQQAFGEYLNATGAMTDFGNQNTRNYGSVGKYFSDMSGGQFTPEFDLVGPVTLSQPLEYYGAGNDDMTRFIPDVCRAADATVDFSQYDQNGDGQADLVYVIYAGYSQSWSGNPEECLWPKSGYRDFGRFDGVKVARYGINNELNGIKGQQEGMINGIGLFCHEFSHCMGMPDLYATSGEATQADNQMMEYWSIMDGGTYLGNGYNPTAYTAWEREAMGWLAIEKLTEKGKVQMASLDNNGKAYRIMNDADASGNEYFILENIQLSGWNSKQKGHGLLVTHVDYDSKAFSLSYNSVNNTLGHPRMTVVAADGLLQNQNNRESAKGYYEQLAGDPFPGTSMVTSLTDNTAVRPVVYTGSALGKPIYNIAEDEATGIVSFDFLEDSTVGIDGVLETGSEAVADGIYTLDGRLVGTDAKMLKKGIYVINGKKAVLGE